MDTLHLNSEQAAGLFAGIGIFALVIGLVVYLFFAFCIKKIADKTGHSEKSWWAWIPLLNALLLMEIAGKPMWWIILMIIPFVNIIILFLVYTEVAKACGKEAVWGIITFLFPYIGLPYLAFSDGPTQPPTSAAM